MTRLDAAPEFTSRADTVTTRGVSASRAWVRRSCTRTYDNVRRGIPREETWRQSSERSEDVTTCSLMIIYTIRCAPDNARVLTELNRAVASGPSPTSLAAKERSARHLPGARCRPGTPSTCSSPAKGKYFRFRQMFRWSLKPAGCLRTQEAPWWRKTLAES